MLNKGDYIGEYEILKKQAKGGMSNIYISMKHGVNKTWVVKEILKNKADPKIEIKIKQARREIAIMEGLEHIYLPLLVDVYETDDALYIVMEHVEGDDLQKILDKEGAQKQSDVIKWSLQLCEVLSYLHHQDPPIIYRDMKPNNVMLQSNGNIKLIDFGVAKEYKYEAKKDTYMFATDGYAAPEQISGGKTDARSDIYSLGVTMHYLLTNSDPQIEGYSHKPIRDYNPELSGGLENIILKCTMPNPDERYQSVDELAYALKNYEKEDDLYILAQNKKRNRFIAMAVVAVLLLGTAVGTRVAASRIINNDFSHYMDQAQLAIDPGEKENYLIKAIDVNGGNKEAYMELINNYKVDDFSVEEEQRFRKTLDGNIDKLKTNGSYGEIAFEVGKLYWYYYDYGNNEGNITKATSAKKWFKDAMSYGNKKADYYEMAEAYYNIGDFYSTITQNVQESSDKGMYAQLFKDLKYLFGLVNEETTEIVALESCSIVMDSINSYAKKMALDNIKKEDMEALFNSAIEATKQIDATTDKTIGIKEDILNIYSECKNSINNAYVKVKT